MNSIALGLGSNQGDRAQQLRSALESLKTLGAIQQVRCSPLVESPAYLKPHAPPEWDLPFLNLVVEAESKLMPNEMLELCKKLEREAGRVTAETWAPRPLDIDILAWGEQKIDAPELCIPHRELVRRAFVLDPWACLSPGRLLSPSMEIERTSLLKLRRLNQTRQPLLMAIVNVTPDSFSDGGEAFSEVELAAKFQSLVDLRPAILDIGGQSTRPGAEIVGSDEEWRRVARALGVLKEVEWRGARPWVSIDTFRPEIARRAIEWGVEIVNDVTGLESLEMVQLARESQAHFIFMHNVGVPADPQRTLSADADVVEVVIDFALKRMCELRDIGVDMHRLIFDPGIGFGKSAHHSLTLIRQAQQLVEALDLRILYGHSRKSYLRTVDPYSAADRDAMTLAHSVQLAQAGVEILRVHNVMAHHSTLLAREKTKMGG